MSRQAKILVETTQKQKTALTTVLEDYGATLTEWFTDNVAEATAEYSTEAISPLKDLPCLEALVDSKQILADLAEIDWAFSDDDTTYLSHDIHPYPAKFIPQIPRNLIARLSLRGETVWDPFGGSGTTALESVLMGRQAISTDVNPLAEVIGKAKLTTLNKEQEDFLSQFTEELLIISTTTESVTDALSRCPSLKENIPNIPNISDWFHPQAVLELAYLRSRILSLPGETSRQLAQVCFSKIILKASYQDGETRYVRCEREFPAGKVIRLFAGTMSSSLKKVRYLGAYLKFRQAIFHTVDLRKESPVKPCSVDLIVTSPPYSNATDYHLYHRFRLFWLGNDPRDLGKREIGSHLRHQKERNGIDTYLDEMSPCLEKMFSALRPGRFAVMVIGDSMFHGKVYHTAQLIADRATAAGFELVGEIDRELPEHRRSFISTARRLRSESLLVLRKPCREIVVSLYPPPYKLWPYECVIRKAEFQGLVGVSAEESVDGVLHAKIHCLKVDRLRRLTFSHSYDASEISRECAWQGVLENGDALKPSSRKDPKYVTHGIHAYKGKFYPQLAKSLFNLAGLREGQTILDPFCGSGTVPLEAYLNGMRGIGIDMNPLAVKIAKAKTGILLVDPYLRDRLLAQFQKKLATLEPEEDANAFSNETIAEIESWFPPTVVKKLTALLRVVREVPHVLVKEYLEVLVSSIVRDISQQDPQDLRIRRRREPIEDAPVLELFLARFLEQRRRLSEFASRSNRAPCEFTKPVIISGDSRSVLSLQSAGVDLNSIDGVVTSPPYATALPYIDTDRLSILLLCGLQTSDRSTIEESLIGSREIRNKQRNELETLIGSMQFTKDIPSLLGRETIKRIHGLNEVSDVGFRRRNMAALLYRYFADMTTVLRNLDRAMRPNASAFFVVGGNVTVAGGVEVQIRSSAIIQEIAVDMLNWRVKDRIPITVTTENRPHVKHSITENDILWLVKE